MPFRRINLLDEADFLTCTVATSVLRHDIRNLAGIGKQVIEKGYDFVISNRSKDKDEQWWTIVKNIEEHFSWDRLLKGDPITAKVHCGSLEFGSINDFGGGCHRSIALAVGVLSKRIAYQPFEILLYCP